MWLLSTSVCDIVIAVSMVYYLRRIRSGVRSTTTLLTRIIRASVETGLICATFAILDLSIFLSFPHNNYHVPMCMCLSKLYSNSLLAVHVSLRSTSASRLMNLLQVLNTRVHIIGGRNDYSASTDFSLSPTICNERTLQNPGMQRPGLAPIQIPGFIPKSNSTEKWNPDQHSMLSGQVGGNHFTCFPVLVTFTPFLTGSLMNDRVLMFESLT